MSDIKIYPDYEPETVTLHGITNEGREISADYYTDGRILLPKTPSLEYAKIAFCTHRKCGTCGKVMDDKTRLHCKECFTKNEYDKYLKLPVVDLQFPIFVNDDFIEDEDSLNDYLYYNEVTSEESVEAHNAKIEEVNVDIVDYLNDLLGDAGYEDFLDDLISKENYHTILRYSTDVQSIVNSIKNMYFADYKTRISIKDFIKKEVGDYLE